MSVIVAVMGTDGSGKSTLSDALVSRLAASGTDACRQWLGAESYLMAPVRSLLRIVWKRPPAAGRVGRTDGYAADISRKGDIAERYAWAVGAYLTAVGLDYRLQARHKLWASRHQQVIVADRYLFDVAVNVGVTLGWTPGATVRLAQEMLADLPIPRVRFYVRAEPAVSLSRKSDIPDIDYLNLRLPYYDAMAEAFGFIALDGADPLDDNAARMHDIVTSRLGVPYVHYVHANNEDVGGADRVLASMALHMRDQGKGRHVAVSLRLPTGAIGLHELNGVPVALAGFLRPQQRRGLANAGRLAVGVPRTLLHFWRLFGRERPDIVHVNDLYDVLPAIAARARRIPVVHHLRMIKVGRSGRMMWRIVEATASATVSVSHAVRDHYTAGAAGPRHHVIRDLGDSRLAGGERNPQDAAGRPDGLPQGERLVVMVGRVEEWKGQAVFIEAVTLLPQELRSRHAFALVGGRVPGHEDYYTAVCRDADRQGITMLGERDDVPEILRAADVCVHCSTTPDPFPGVVVEGMLAGTAVVAANAGGVPEMIASPREGVLYEPGSATELCEALTRLLTSPTPPREEYGDRARNRILALVDPDAVDGALAELYDQLTEPPASRGASTASTRKADRRA